jgi:xanthine dehydrogenase accessory factor
MSDQTCILVLGLGPVASAAARLLFLAGYGVVLFQRESPRILRRQMCFADVWADGSAFLDGVEARMARRDADFVAGLRQRSFIPFVGSPVAEAIERWPWDIVVDCASESASAATGRFDADFRIGMGCGPVAGEDCDIVIATEGPDPGAVIGKGSAPRDRGRSEPNFGGAGRARAPRGGEFRTERAIGAFVAKGDNLGYVGETEIKAAWGGRVIGLRRSGDAVSHGEALAEIAPDARAHCVGVGKAEQAIARAVLFALQMESNGWEPVDLTGLVNFRP